MTTNKWELILDPALDGATNMAIDGELLAAIESSTEPRTVLRFYSWIRPTISYGRSQPKAKAVNIEFCRKAGIDVVRRPTGGRVVLHDDELTYAVISNDPSYFSVDSIYETYKRISEALSQGYRSLGVETVLAADTRLTSRQKDGSSYPCFASPSRYELMVEGRKILGSAQRRLRRSFLQHGSMPISCNRLLLAHATHLEDAALLDSEMCGLADCLEELPNIDEMTDAFIEAFGHYFSVKFLPH